MENHEPKGPNRGKRSKPQADKPEVAHAAGFDVAAADVDFGGGVADLGAAEDPLTAFSSIFRPLVVYLEPPRILKINLVTISSPPLRLGLGLVLLLQNFALLSPSVPSSAQPTTLRTHCASQALVSRSAYSGRAPLMRFGKSLVVVWVALAAALVAQESSRPVSPAEIRASLQPLYDANRQKAADPGIIKKVAGNPTLLREFTILLFREIERARATQNTVRADSFSSLLKLLSELPQANGWPEVLWSLFLHSPEPDIRAYALQQFTPHRAKVKIPVEQTFHIARALGDERTRAAALAFIKAIREDTDADNLPLNPPFSDAIFKSVLLTVQLSEHHGDKATLENLYAALRHLYSTTDQVDFLMKGGPDMRRLALALVERNPDLGQLPLSEATSLAHTASFQAADPLLQDAAVRILLKLPADAADTYARIAVHLLFVNLALAKEFGESENERRTQANIDRLLARFGTVELLSTVFENRLDDAVLAEAIHQLAESRLALKANEANKDLIDALKKAMLLNPKTREDAEKIYQRIPPMRDLSPLEKVQEEVHEKLNLLKRVHQVMREIFLKNNMLADILTAAKAIKEKDVLDSIDLDISSIQDLLQTLIESESDDDARQTLFLRMANLTQGHSSVASYRFTRLALEAMLNPDTRSAAVLILHGRILHRAPDQLQRIALEALLPQRTKGAVMPNLAALQQEVDAMLAKQQQVEPEASMADILGRANSLVDLFILRRWDATPFPTKHTWNIPHILAANGVPASEARALIERLLQAPYRQDAIEKFEENRGKYVLANSDNNLLPSVINRILKPEMLWEFFIRKGVNLTILQEAISILAEAEDQSKQAFDFLPGLRVLVEYSLDHEGKPSGVSVYKLLNKMTYPIVQALIQEQRFQRNPDLFLREGSAHHLIDIWTASDSAKIQEDVLKTIGRLNPNVFVRLSVEALPAFGQALRNSVLRQHLETAIPHIILPTPEIARAVLEAALAEHQRVSHQGQREETLEITNIIQLLIRSARGKDALREIEQTSLDFRLTETIHSLGLLGRTLRSPQRLLLAARVAERALQIRA